MRRGMGCGKGVSTSPLREESGEGVVPKLDVVPLPRKILHFLHQNYTSVMHSDTLLK